MNANVAMKQYSDVKVKAAVESASPHELIQMLFDGLLERISQAKGAVIQEEIELKGAKINQAISILFGLRESLNTGDNANNLAGGLDSLYDYVQRRLWEAHVKNDIDAMDECHKLIVEVSSAWKEIA